jgi:hypothetical protein
MDVGFPSGKTVGCTHSSLRSRAVILRMVTIWQTSLLNGLA